MILISRRLDEDHRLRQSSLIKKKKKKEERKTRDDYSKFCVCQLEYLGVTRTLLNGFQGGKPCLPRKSLVSQSNRTQNHGAESRLTARRRENTLCYRRKGLFENARRKPEEATVTRVGSSNFSTSHWNTESYPSLHLFLSLSLVRFNTSANTLLYTSTSLCLSFRFFLLREVMPPHESTFYIYFNSVIDATTPPARLCRRQDDIESATSKFLSRGLLFLRGARIGFRETESRYKSLEYRIKCCFKFAVFFFFLVEHKE